MEDREEPLALHINSEPNIYQGCNSSELMMIAIGSVGVLLPVGVIIGVALAGSLPFGMGISVFSIVIVMVVAPKMFRRIKRGKPEGYYQIRLFTLLGKSKLMKALGYKEDYIMKDGRWDLGRRG